MSVCRYRKRWHKVSTHSHPEVAADVRLAAGLTGFVSTHSHPEVAAKVTEIRIYRCKCFNTQPPGGGCPLHKKARKISKLNTVLR